MKLAKVRGLGYRTITVTQQNIDEGCRYALRNCPIARAMIAQGYRGVFVDRIQVSWRNGAYCRCEALPPIARAFVDVFDGRAHSWLLFPNGAAPFEFRLPR